MDSQSAARAANLEIQAWPRPLPIRSKRLAQRHGNVVAEGHMGGRRIEDAEPLVLEIAAQPGLDLVADDAARTALPQSLGSEPHRFLQERAGVVFADELVEALPVAQLLSGGIFDGFGERPLAADLDQRRGDRSRCRRPI